MAEPVYRIHPAIGIIRVGNADRNTYFLGPELPGDGPKRDLEDHERLGADAPPYKDHGQLKPQAARFRIWEYVETKGKLAPSREITLDTPDCTAIYWKVHLANRKASFFRFEYLKGEEAGSSPPRRNAGVTNRRTLEIDPGEREIPARSPAAKNTRNAGPVEFRKGTGPNELWPDPPPSRPIEYLGELRTDGAGRLIVIGGKGLSSGRSSASLTDAFNNDGWFDDIADGPVTAMLLMKVKGASKRVPVQGAWVLGGPPDFAPSLRNQVTLYDVLFDLAVKQMSIPKNEAIFDTMLKPLADLHAELLRASTLSRYTPSFDEEIFPIIQRAADTIFTVDSLQGSHSFRANYAVLGDPGATAATARQQFFDRIHKPGVVFSAISRANMPLMHGDAYNDARHPRNMLTVTDTQYALLKRWVNGHFTKTAGVFPPPRPAWMNTITPHGLDRAALENCVGGAFAVGIETSWQIRNKELYAAPFRLKDHYDPDTSKRPRSQYRGDTGLVRAGHFSRQMALPWQTDFLSCRFFGGRAWWPAQRPDIVYVSKADFDDRAKPPVKTKDWTRPSTATWPLGNPTPTREEFVEHYWKLGLVYEVSAHHSYHLEWERNTSVPEGGAVFTGGDADVFVAGGGPAGCAAAIAARRGGAKVILACQDRPAPIAAVDRLAPWTTPLLADLDLLSGIVVPVGAPCPGVRSLWGPGEPITQRAIFDPHGGGWVVDRSRFDSFLRDAAAARGAHIIRGAVTRVAPLAGGWNLRVSQEGGEDTTYRTRALLLATGRGGRLPRLLGAEATAAAGEVALLAHFDRIEPAWVDDPLFLVEAFAGGWAYAMPAPTGGAVGAICLPAESYRGPAKDSLRTLWDRWHVKTVLLRGAIGAAAPGAVRARAAHAQRRRPVAGPGWALAGDVACALSPLSGQGVGFALESGRLAALALVHGGGEFLRYAQWVEDYWADHERVRAQFVR